MAEIQNKLASSEFSASLDIAANLSDLDPESFQNVMKQTSDLIDKRDEEARETLTKLIASVNSQQTEGLISVEEAERQKSLLYDSYYETMGSARAEASSAISKAIENNYKAEFEGYRGEFLEQYEQLEKDLQDHTGLAGAIFQKLISRPDMDIETKIDMEELWKEMDDSFHSGLNDAKKHYSDLGKAIPPEISKGLIDSATIGAMAGDEEAMWFLIGQQIKDNPEYYALLEDLKPFAGTLFDAIVAGASTESEELKKIRTIVQSQLSAIFANPFDVTAKLNLTTATNTVNTSSVSNVLSNLGRSEAINKEFNKLNNKGLPGFATGGIIQNPTLATFAEDGPEAAIPIDGSQRSIDLWKKTGELLGVFDGKSRAETSLSKLEDSSSSEGLSINFAPVLNFNGGTPSKDDIVEANRMSLREFEEMYKQLVKKNSRLGFAN